MIAKFEPVARLEDASGMPFEGWGALPGVVQVRAKARKSAKTNTLKPDTARLAKDWEVERYE